jgi:type I restriction enzyme, S subunit
VTTTASSLSSSTSLTSRYKPYPRFKDSGIEWLGEVPETWNVKPLKFAVRMNPDVLDENTLASFAFRYADISSITPDGRIGDTESTDFGSAPSRARHKVQKADTILSTVRTYLKAIAIVDNDAEELIVSTGFAVLRPKDFEPRFLWRLAQCEPFVQDVMANSEGVAYPGISPSRLGRRQTWLPSREEQQAIAEFLDRLTAKIDNLIAKKERLLELLEEKRAALVTHAVTRGLNPDAPLRDSGIEWLGQIPKHWEVRRLKFVASIQTGFAFSSDDFVTDGIPLLRIGDITADGQIDLSDAKFLPVEFITTQPDVVVRTRDIVMAMTGATIGKVGRYPGDAPALLNQRVCIFRPESLMEHNYLWYVLNSRFYIEHVLLIAFGGAQSNISDTELLDCFIPLPDDDEQREISEYLDGEMEKIMGMATQIRVAIDRLKEYRAALITAAVTGKIDVRGATID